MLSKKKKLELELKSDLAWLRLKATRLIDSLVLTQNKISETKFRLRKLNERET